jgi:hypothetical protein
MFRKLFITIIISSAFLYGVAVGHYRFFPYDQIQSIKATAPKPGTIPYNKHPLYISYQKLFNGSSAEYDVVFLGDSITSAGRWSEAFPTINVANRGIPGDTSKGILSRLDSIIQHNPKIAYLMFGINDISKGESAVDIFNRYQKIVDRLRSNNIDVVMQSTLLSDRHNWNKVVVKLNKKLEIYADELKLSYIDLNKIMAPSGSLTTEASFDGVHLKAELYLEWFKLIENNALSNTLL